MTKKEMIRNVQHLSLTEQAIQPIRIPCDLRDITIDRLTVGVHNVMFERFVSEVVTDSVICGISAPNSRKFAVDFIQNNDYVQNCLTATVNLVLNGAFSKKYQLDSFINRLLWVHVVKACNEKLGTGSSE